MMRSLPCVMVNPISQNCKNALSNERKVANRSGKVYIDHLQNLKRKTIASVYSVRPFPYAPVSTPLSWDELPDYHTSMFTIKTIPTRLYKISDLFKPLLSLEQEPPTV
jgi:bifunctional non-homologous end joining protein LigD